MNSQQEDQQHIYQYLYDQNILAQIRNQDPVIKKIFSHPHALSDVIQLVNGSKPKYPIRKQQQNVTSSQIIGSLEQKKFTLHPEDNDPHIRLHYMAAQILSMQSHHITSMLFNSEQDHEHQNKQENIVEQQIQPKLITELLGFLNSSSSQSTSDYMLVVYFNKIISALTKRASMNISSTNTATKNSSAYRYNKILGEKIYKEGYLFKTLNHMYSEVINEVILRWVGFRVHPDHLYSQPIQGDQVEIKPVQLSQYNWESIAKSRFMCLLGALINYNKDFTHQVKQQNIDDIFNSTNITDNEQWCQLYIPYIQNLCSETISSVAELILLFLRAPANTPSKPPPYASIIKNTSLIVNKQTQKLLYENFCQSQTLQHILQPIPSPSSQKLVLITKIIDLYKMEQQYYKDKEGERVWLGETINFEKLQEIYCWVHELIRQFFLLHQIASTQQQNQEPNQNRKVNKRQLVVLLELLEMLQSLPILQQNLLLGYYQTHAEHLVLIVKNILLVNSNIIHTILIRIVINQVLHGYGFPATSSNLTNTNQRSNLWIAVGNEKGEEQKGENSPEDMLTEYKFPQKLLSSCVLQLIDNETLREHLLKLSKILLNNRISREHIYQNFQQEYKYEHIIDLIQQNDSNLGQIHHTKLRSKFTFIDGGARLDVFYSSDRAKKVYERFLSSDIVIQWNKGKDTNKINKDLQQELPDLSMKKNFSSPPIIESYQTKQKVTTKDLNDSSDKLSSQQSNQATSDVRKEKKEQNNQSSKQQTKEQKSVQMKEQRSEQLKEQMEEEQKYVQKYVQKKVQKEQSKQAEDEVEILEIKEEDWQRQGYITYDADQLIDQLE